MASDGSTEPVNAAIHVDPSPANATQVLDHNHPLYLHNIDVSGISLISLQLTGVENYNL